MTISKTLGALAAVAALTLPLAAAAQSVAPVQVEGRAPTVVRIALAGRPVVAVKHDVRIAAGTVCRNAATNRELAFYDVDWCQRATQARALSRYAAILKHNRGQLAESDQMILAVRWAAPGRESCCAARPDNTLRLTLAATEETPTAGR